MEAATFIGAASCNELDPAPDHIQHITMAMRHYAARSIPDNTRPSSQREVAGRSSHSRRRTSPTAPIPKPDGL